MVLGSASASMAQVRRDTVLTAPPGGQLRLIIGEGEARVHPGAASRIRIRTEQDATGELSIISSQSGVEVMASDETRPRRGTRFDIEVPIGYRVQVTATKADLTFAGALGELAATLQRGSIEVSGATSTVSVTIFQGAISVSDITGPVTALAFNGDIGIERARGNVVVRNTSGHIRIAETSGDSTLASSVDGDVSYAGALRRGSHYQLQSHTNDVLLIAPIGSGAEVRAFTQRGTLVSDVRWQPLSGNNGRAMRMRMGDGAASVVLESFSGTIEVRPRGRGLP